MGDDKTSPPAWIRWRHRSAAPRTASPHSVLPARTCVRGCHATAV